MRRTTLFVCLLFAACATPYQQMGFRGGYAETQIAGDRYVVRTEVNKFTADGTAYEFLLRRAQEVCVASGFQSFRIGGAAVTATATTTVEHQQDAFSPPVTTATTAMDQRTYVADVQCVRAPVAPVVQN